MSRSPPLNGWSLNSAVTRLRLKPRLSVVVQRNPSVVSRVDVDRGERDLEALVLHVAHVVEHAGEAGRARDRPVEQQVARLLQVIVGREADPAARERHVEAQVELLGRLPLEVGVRQVARRDAGRVAVVGAAEQPLERIVADRLVAGEAVARAQLQVLEEAALQERLLAQEPTGADAAGKKPHRSFGPNRDSSRRCGRSRPGCTSGPGCSSPRAKNDTRLFSELVASPSISRAALLHLGEVVVAEAFAADEVELAAVELDAPAPGGLELASGADVGRRP